MSISPLESWLTVRYLLPKLDTGAPGTVSLAQLYECPPARWGKGSSRVVRRSGMHPRYSAKMCSRSTGRSGIITSNTSWSRGPGSCGRKSGKDTWTESRWSWRDTWGASGGRRDWRKPPGWQTPKIYLKGKWALCVSPPALLLLMTHCNKYSENSA